VRVARTVLESGDCLALPDKFEIHEWALMERFSISEAREDRRDELLDAIHGAGAFRSFRSTIRRLGIEDEWFAFQPAIGIRGNRQRLARGSQDSVSMTTRRITRFALPPGPG
jgi:hypothetical protein